MLVATKLLTAKLYSLYVKESESVPEILERSELGVGVGNFGKVGHFTSDSATLLLRVT